jgi:DNA-binding transcriptional LysR family regulator
VPQDIATVVGRHVAIKEIALPFRPPQLQLQQYWHRRMQNDPANRWLRGLFYDVNRREAGAQMPG